MTDAPLPDDLAEIAREAEALVAAAQDADAKQAAAKLAVQNAVEQIVNKAQEAVTKLYGYLKPGSATPVLIVAWPTADAPAAPATPVVNPEAEAPVIMPAPVAEAPPAPPAEAPAPVVEAPSAPPVAPVAEAPAQPAEPAAPEAPPAEQVIVPPADDFPVGEPAVEEQPVADPNAAGNTESTNG